jgi:hypothetical protein
MALLTGYIGGLIRWESGDPLSTKMIPFQNTIESVTLSYTGELAESKTFNGSGIKVSTAGCLTEVSATIEFSTTNITFGFLQAAAATLAEENDGDIYVSNTQVLPTNGAIALDFPPVTGTAVCATRDGVILPGTVSGSTFTVTNPSGFVGQAVTVSYLKAVGNPAESVIRVGSGEGLPPVGVYGRFFSCEGSYTFMANKVIIVPNLSLSVGDSPAEVGFTGTILADETDTLFTLVKEPLNAP